MKRPMRTDEKNLTGLAVSPELAKAMLELPKLTVPSSDGDALDTAAPRFLYAEEAAPFATEPNTQERVQPGKVSELTLLDKLGERLAFERMGTRLYEALLLKFDAYGTWKGGPTREEIESIHRDELRHFMLLMEAMVSLGADPTAVTPSADLSAVTSQGIPAVLLDPRTNVFECLEAIAVAELADNDCWTHLSQLTLNLGHVQLAQQFEEALVDEREHLVRVRAWLGMGLGVQPVAGDVVSLEERRRPKAKPPKRQRKTKPRRTAAKTARRRVTPKRKRR